MQILVPSTNAQPYRDCWQPWIRLAAIHWPDRPWPTVLVAHGDAAMRPEAAGYDEVRAPDVDLGWSRNLFFALRGLDPDDLVLMVLDDMLPLAPVDTDAIKSATRILQKKQSLGCLRLHPCPGPAREVEVARLAGSRCEYPVGVIHRGESYRISTMPAIWRVAYLRRLLGLCERGGAWAFERPDGLGPAALWADDVWAVWRSARQPWPLEIYATAIVRGVWQPDALAMLDKHKIQRPLL